MAKPETNLLNLTTIDRSKFDHAHDRMIARITYKQEEGEMFTSNP